MTDSHWYLRIPANSKEREEVDRAVAKHVMEEFLPEHEQWYEKLVRDGIIPVEMLEALFDTSRDPLDRQATMDRIFGMVEEYTTREQEKRTVSGMLKKVLSDMELFKSQAENLHAATPSISDLEPPIKAGNWSKPDWINFFHWIAQVYGSSQPDWKHWANKTGKAHSTLRSMYSRYQSGDLDVD